jgi:hypothetical protein
MRPVRTILVKLGGDVVVRLLDQRRDDLPATGGRWLRVRLYHGVNRILQLPGASVRTVAFTGQGIVIGLRRRRRRLLCPCGATTRARYDTSRRRWRHLDFGACRVWLEADIHRGGCRTCREVCTEQVPWAGPNARAQQRLRERRGLVGAADGQDQHRPAAALLLGGRRRDRRPGGDRPHLRLCPGPSLPHRGGRDLLQARPPVPDYRGRPRHRHAGLGRQATLQDRVRGVLHRPRPAACCLRQPGCRIEEHFDAIVAAVELGLSNSRLEGINAKIRLIQRRGYGFRNLLEEMPSGDRDGPPVGRHGAHEGLGRR